MLETLLFVLLFIVVLIAANMDSVIKYLGDWKLHMSQTDSLSESTLSEITTGYASLDNLVKLPTKLTPFLGQVTSKLSSDLGDFGSRLLRVEQEAKQLEHLGDDSSTGQMIGLAGGYLMHSPIENTSVIPKELQRDVMFPKTTESSFWSSSWKHRPLIN